MLKQDQAKSEDAIKYMHDGLQALITGAEESKTAGKMVKNQLLQVETCTF